MPAVLFVCTANQYRSPIAAAHLALRLEQRGASGWRVESAGTWTETGRPLMKDANRAAIALERDLSGHTTRVVDDVMLNGSDLILVMESGHKEALQQEFPDARARIFLLTELEEGLPSDIPDPSRFPLERDRILRDMCDLIDRELPRIEELATNFSNSRADAYA